MNITFRNITLANASGPQVDVVVVDGRIAEVTRALADGTKRVGHGMRMLELRTLTWPRDTLDTAGRQSTLIRRNAP